MLLAFHTTPFASDDTDFAHVDAAIAVLFMTAAHWFVLMIVLKHKYAILGVVTAMNSRSHTPVLTTQ